MVGFSRVYAGIVLYVRMGGWAGLGGRSTFSKFCGERSTFSKKCEEQSTCSKFCGERSTFSKNLWGTIHMFQILWRTIHIFISKMWIVRGCPKCCKVCNFASTFSFCGRPHFHFENVDVHILRRSKCGRPHFHLENVDVHISARNVDVHSFVAKLRYAALSILATY